MFELACRKYNLPECEKMDMLKYPLIGAAKTDYLHNRSQCNDFIEAKITMFRTYHCSSRQLQVVTMLEQLPYRRFMVDKEYTDPVCGVKEIVEKIKSLIPLSPPAYHLETQNIMLLKRE